MKRNDSIEEILWAELKTILNRYYRQIFQFDISFIKLSGFEIIN
jgi:hypothetical protein